MIYGGAWRRRGVVGRHRGAPACSGGRADVRLAAAAAACAVGGLVRALLAGEPAGPQPAALSLPFRTTPGPLPQAPSSPATASWAATPPLTLCLPSSRLAATRQASSPRRSAATLCATPAPAPAPAAACTQRTPWCGCRRGWRWACRGGGSCHGAGTLSAALPPCCCGRECVLWSHLLCWASYILVPDASPRFTCMRPPFLPPLQASAIEALGMSLPYSSSTPAEDPLKRLECRMAGRWVGCLGWDAQLHGGRMRSGGGITSLPGKRSGAAARHCTRCISPCPARSGLSPVTISPCPPCRLLQLRA